MKGGALQAILLHPLGGAREHVLAVVIEAQHERPVHLDAVVMQHANAAGVVGGLRRLLAGVGEVLVGERLEADEHAGAARQRHVADQLGSSVTSIDTAALQIFSSGRSARTERGRYSRREPRLLSTNTA